ncbi:MULTISPECIES: DUF6571 family protein [Actinomyces]|uniref:DUF6571 family protein n=1 Tax=Actinomyces TaxID=1654 RepID=UPI00021D3518|nr:MULTISPECIES: DUF6571 family protein [Actinomyces]EGV13804.1 hypothetical protein HMPREF9058_1481 [Actinomyces sp. oral taxon 175 str. F0384]
MGTIKLNPDKLKKKIKGLRDKSDEAGRARASIDTESERLGDPSPSKAVDTFCNNSATHINDVRACANRIESDMNRIIELNQNGIATMNGGTITVENVPDTVLKGGKNEFDAWSQGALDGKDAQTLANGGTPKSGRTPSEVQASMEANKDKSSYATAFIDGVGPENITKLPITFASEQQKEESGFNTQLASTLGNILAAATSSWSSEKNKEVSDKILQTVDCENSEKDPTTYRAEQINEAKQLVALNYILGSHDNDGNYVNDLRFGTDFLVRMAEGLEKIDPGKIETLRLNAKFSNEDKAFYAMYEKGLSFNPMSGVLDAMGGNADAALKYLAPSGKNGQVDTSRVDKLTKYDWSWDPTGFGGLTSAIAAASSKRSSTATNPSGGPSESERARQLAGVAVHEIAANVPQANPHDWAWDRAKYPKGTTSYDNAAKVHIAQLLANCAPELTEAWDNGSAVNPSTGEKLPRTTEDDFNKLTYRVADNENATATIAAGIAKHATERSAELIAENAGNKEAQLQHINQAYSQGSSALNHLTAIADVRADDNTKASENDASVKTAASSAALTAFTAVATGGLSAPFQIGASVATTTLTSPIITDKVFGADKVKSTMNTNPDEQMWAYAVRDAANAELLNENDFSAPGSENYSWIVENSDGKHRIDLSKASQEDLKDVKSWTDTVHEKLKSEKPDANSSSGKTVVPGDPAFETLAKNFNGKSSDGHKDGHNDAASREKPGVS